MKRPLVQGVLIGDGRWFCQCRTDRGQQRAYRIQCSAVEHCERCKAVKPDRDFGPNPLGRDSR